MRSLLLGLVLASAGCAAAPPVIVARGERPFMARATAKSVHFGRWVEGEMTSDNETIEPSPSAAPEQSDAPIEPLECKGFTAEAASPSGLLRAISTRGDSSFSCAFGLFGGGEEARTSLVDGMFGGGECSTVALSRGSPPCVRRISSGRFETVRIDLGVRFVYFVYQRTREGWEILGSASVVRADGNEPAVRFEELDRDRAFLVLSSVASGTGYFDESDQWFALHSRGEDGTLPIRLVVKRAGHEINSMALEDRIWSSTVTRETVRGYATLAIDVTVRHVVFRGSDPSNSRELEVFRRHERVRYPAAVPSREPGRSAEGEAEEETIVPGASWLNHPAPAEFLGSIEAELRALAPRASPEQRDVVRTYLEGTCSIDVECVASVPFVRLSKLYEDKPDEVQPITRLSP